jgi:hypothetical protein
MNGKKVISLLTILVLVSLMTCPLMAYPITKPAAHDCSGKSKDNDQKQHFCCDQQAITAKVFKQVSDSTVVTLKFCEAQIFLRSIEGHNSAFLNHSDSKDLLAKLSVLRI